jgi:leader peptidase (prepilin peptidase) / N-methyltransferase
MSVHPVRRVHIFFCATVRHGRVCKSTLAGARVVKTNAPINIVGVTVGVATVAASIAAVPGVAGWFGAGLALTMLAIAVIDARRFIIPDPLNAAGLALGLTYAAVQGEGDALNALAVAVLRAAVLASAFLALRLLYAFVRGRQGIGLGDIKLAAVAGAWLGWAIMPVAIEIAAVSALAVYATRRYLFGRSVRAATRLPFGLFFAPAIWVGWLLESTVLQFW